MIFSPIGIKQQLGKRIQRLRVSRGWTQETLAELAGLHRNYIGHVERAELNVGIVNLDKIARAFEISLHEMFNMDNLDDQSRAEESAVRVCALGEAKYRKSPPLFVSRRNENR